MATLTGSTTGGVVARRMLPAAFFLPILLGWIVRMSTRDLGAVVPGLDPAIFVVISILLFCAPAVGTVRAVDRQEAGLCRAIAEQGRGDPRCRHQFQRAV